MLKELKKCSLHSLAGFLEDFAATNFEFENTMKVKEFP